MRFPSQDPVEIQEMVGLQLIGHLPYAVEDVIHRFRVLDRDEHGYSLVLVIVVCKDALRSYEAVLCQAGITSGILILNSFGLRGWLRHQERSYPMPDNSGTALLDIGAQDPQICFCGNGKLFFDRMLSRKNALAQEVCRSLELYRDECHGPPVRKIWILSQENTEASMMRKIQERTGVPVETVDPLKDIECADPFQTKERIKFSMAAGIGALLLGPEDLCSWQLNEHAAQCPKSMWKPRIAATVSIVLILFLGLHGQLKSIHKNQTYLLLLKAQAERLQERSRRAEEKIRFVRSLEGQSQDIFVPDLVDALISAVPPEISLKTFYFGQDGNLTVQGCALTHAGVSAFQEGLMRSPRFSRVDLRFAANSQIARLSVVDFRIDLRLRAREAVRP
jgi:hypothetical protein